MDPQVKCIWWSISLNYHDDYDADADNINEDDDIDIILRSNYN